MITGIVTLTGGICVMLGSGVALSAALTWMNTFEFEFKGKKSKTKHTSSHAKASEGRNRLSGGKSFDMFE